MEDDFKKFVNGRRPQKIWKWKMTSKDLKMEDNPFKRNTLMVLTLLQIWLVLTQNHTFSPFNCYWLLLRSSSFSKKNWSSSILNFFQVVFHFQKNLMLSSIFKSFEVIFHFQIFWGRLPFTNILMSSSIFKIFDLVFYFKHV